MTIMRPWRIGTRSGSRLVACSAMMSTGLSRPGGGSQTACTERGSARRAALPFAAASSALTWSTRFSRERSTLVAGSTPSASASALSSGALSAPLLFPCHCGGSHCRCSFCPFLAWGLQARPGPIGDSEPKNPERRMITQAPHGRRPWALRGESPTWESSYKNLSSTRTC